MAGLGRTGGILIEFWQHLPSVITPSMAMTEGDWALEGGGEG